MSLLPINLCGDKILTKKVRKVKTINDKTIKFISDMFETMREANGIGLAANQVGRESAIIVIDLSEMEGYEHIRPMIVINPVIKEKIGDSVYEEGCLSVPGIRYKINRPESILIEYQDTDLVLHTELFDGLLARVLQHEIDHLNGIIFIDYIPNEQLKEFEVDIIKIKERELEFEYSVTKA